MSPSRRAYLAQLGFPDPRVSRGPRVYQVQQGRLGQLVRLGRSALRGRPVDVACLGHVGLVEDLVRAVVLALEGLWGTEVHAERGAQGVVRLPMGRDISWVRL